MNLKHSSFLRVLLLMLLLLSLATAEAKVWSADEVPMVHLRDSNRYVCDPEELLSDEARDTADYYLHRLHRQGGVQTVFVIVRHVKNADCFRMAQDIGNNRGVGQKGIDRGLVVVIAVDDRRYFIAPGKGLEGDLTDAECDQIARACIVSNMKQEDIDATVYTTCKALSNKLVTGKTGVSFIDNKQQFIDDDSVGLPYIILLFFIIGGVYKNSRSRKSRGARGSIGGYYYDSSYDYGGYDNDSSSGGDFGGGSFGGGGAGGGW